MKKALWAAAALLAVAACGNKKTANEVKFIGETVTIPGVAETVNGEEIPFTQVDAPQVDLACFPLDEDGYYQIFNGKDLAGWRGYGLTL